MALMKNRALRTARQGTRLLSWVWCFSRKQAGITGLETAIVLIAFVAVASVFGFAVLSIGLFSSDKSKETVRAGMEEARSTIELKGSVTASATLTTVTGVNLVGEFVGTGNGSKKTFALPIDQMRPNFETIYLDGTPQTRDVDYTMNYSGGVAKFTTAPVVDIDLLLVRLGSPTLETVFGSASSSGGGY